MKCLSNLSVLGQIFVLIVFFNKVDSGGESVDSFSSSFSSSHSISSSLTSSSLTSSSNLPSSDLSSSIESSSIPPSSISPSSISPSSIPPSSISPSSISPSSISPISISPSSISQSSISPSLISPSSISPSSISPSLENLSSNLSSSRSPSSIVPTSSRPIFNSNQTTSDFCMQRNDITDGVTYFGSICFVSIYKTWQEALNFCEEKGMFLFRIVNTIGEITLFRAAEDIYGQFSGQSIWVNAKKNMTYWTSYENSTQTVIREFQRLQWVDKAAQTAGDCMSITNRIGPFRVAGTKCNETAPFACSYKNPALMPSQV